MADEDRDQDGPSLELPSFGFGRKRRKQAVAPESAETDETQPMPATPAEESPAPEVVREDAPPEPAPGQASGPARERPPTSEPAPVPEAPAAPPLFVDEAAPRRQPAPEPEPEPAPRPETEPRPVPAVEPAAGASDESGSARRRPQLPAIGGRAAAVVTGLLVGVLTVGLTWAALGLCDAVKGTSSCGNPGYLLLVAILIAMVLLGSALLRAWGTPDATSISLLAVGLLAVFVLVFLVSALESWTMILVIPLVTAAAYALSHWVTAAITEDAAR